MSFSLPCLKPLSFAVLKHLGYCSLYVDVTKSPIFIMWVETAESTGFSTIIFTQSSHACNFSMIVLVKVIYCSFIGIILHKISEELCYVLKCKHEKGWGGANDCL